MNTAGTMNTQDTNMGTYSTSDIAVLLIDMQRSFFKNIDESEKGKLIESQLEVIQYCHSQDIPIIHIEYRNQGRTIPEIKHALKQTSKIYISKSAPDAFSTDSLERTIRNKLHRNTLFLMGVYASECVYSSGWGAKELGFEVISSQDVIADSSDTTYYTLIGRNESLESFYKKKDIKLYKTYKDFFSKLKN